MCAIRVFVESGKKRVMVGAAYWPGWCRGGRDECAALQALVDCGMRYAAVLEGWGLDFRPASDLTDLIVVERQVGNATTDFGAPALPLALDAGPLEAGEPARMVSILRACWRAFDAAAGRASGRELRMGPRGGGRELAEIVAHVLEADRNYLARVAWKLEGGGAGDAAGELARTREAILAALERAVNEGLPQHGPRGGAIWRPRYFVRRVAWHVLDHAWEIEDRID